MHTNRWAPYLLPARTYLLLSALWMWLYRPVFAYLGVIFSRQEFRTNQILLLAVLALIGFRLSRARPSLPQPEDFHPRFQWPALALALGCSLLYLAVERFLDIRSLSAALFGLATYGLLGLWLEPAPLARWFSGRAPPGGRPAVR